jgi:Tfp pilus assembly PilM family ATPase/Tfp pilus assembly protein PilN
VIYLRASVGIEIRQEDLLISCLKNNFAGNVFTQHARISGYRQRDPEQVRREIDAFFKGGKVSRDNVVLGIPRRDVILRYLDLPREVEDNLKQVMLYQVQSFEPTDEDKLYYDFALLKSGKADKKLQVLVAMVRKSALDAHLQIMKQIGIHPTSVTAGSVALANMLVGTLNGNRDKTFFLADLRSDGIEFVVLRGGALIYSRDSTRTDDLSLKQLLLSEMEVAAGKVRLDPEEAIESIILAGEESESVVEELREDFPACELMGSRLRFKMPPQNRALLKDAVTSLGLAYAGITRGQPMKLNLLPAGLRVHQKRWAYIPTFILGLSLTALGAGFAFRQMVQQQTLIRQLDQEYKALEGPANRVKELRTQMQNLEKRIHSIEEVLNRRDQNLEVLRELTGLLPTDTYLTYYRNQDCTFSLNGQSPPSSSSDLIGKIEKSPLLKDVVTTTATFKNQQTGKDIFQLSAKCEK